MSCPKVTKSPARKAASALAYSAFAWAASCAATGEFVDVAAGVVVPGDCVPAPDCWAPDDDEPPKIAVRASPKVEAITTFCC